MGKWIAWTAEDDDLLIRLHADGLLFSQIAAHLLNKSKNACIGRAARLKLPKRYRSPALPASRGNRHLGSTNATAIARNAAFRAAYVPPPLEPTAAMIDIMELTAHTCHWPIGDPKQAGFGFCGSEDGTSEPIHRPYCGAHARLAYQMLER